MYWHLDTQHKQETWDLLKSLNNKNGHACMVSRNFNEILDNNDNWGGEKDGPKKLLTIVH